MNPYDPITITQTGQFISALAGHGRFESRWSVERPEGAGWESYVRMEWDDKRPTPQYWTRVVIVPDVSPQLSPSSS
jgi:hypothetical protein